MAAKKKVIGETAKSLWQQTDKVKSIPLRKYVKDVADTEKIILFAESSGGKTSWYLSILDHLKKQEEKNPDEILMYIVYPDRPTGLSKLVSMIPDKYLDCVHVLPVGTYEELMRSTGFVEEKLDEHYKKTGTHGWVVFELLEEMWMYVQDYYCRKTYGESLAEYFAKKKADVKAMKDDDSAYKALSGWGDWPVIKFFHNFSWIDKVKRMPFNVVFTAELKMEGNKDSVFYDLGYRPAGEKDNMHRVDSIIHLSHSGNTFKMKPYKLTGYKRLYGTVNITNKNPFTVHKKALHRLAEMGYKTSAIEELEEEAEIEPPTEKKKPKKKKKSSKKEEKEEDEDWEF